MAKAKATKKADKKPPPKKAKAAKTAATAAKKKKPKKAVPEYARPEALHAYDFETQKAIGEMEHDVETLETKWLKLKEQTADAKKMYEGRLAEMREYVRERTEGRGKPPRSLFEQAERADAAAKMKSEHAKTGAAAAEASAKREPKGGKKEGGTIPFETTAAPDAAAWFPDDLWKKYPLERFSIYGCTKGDLEKVMAGDTKRDVPSMGPLKTVGDLQAFTQPPAGSTWNRTYADIKGIGPAGVERLSNAETHFWSAWKKGLAEEFAVEQGFTKPLKVHEPGDAADGNETPPGTGKKGTRKRQRKAAGDEDPDGPATLTDVLDNELQDKLAHDAAVEAGEKTDDEA